MDAPQTTVTCEDCDAVLNPSCIDNATSAPCPSCGGTKRRFDTSLRETIPFRDSMRMTVRDPAARRRRRVACEAFTGWDLNRDTGRLFHKDRVIDRRNDRYVEKVVDPKTGQVVYECDEPLSQHQGRGSAKPRGSLK